MLLILRINKKLHVELVTMCIHVELNSARNLCEEVALVWVSNSDTNNNNNNNKYICKAP